MIHIYSTIVLKLMILFRYGPFQALTTDILAKSAGIPSFTFQLLRNERPSYSDPIYFWKNQYSSLSVDWA
jgi:hypothetical protein